MMQTIKRKCFIRQVIALSRENVEKCESPALVQSSYLSLVKIWSLKNDIFLLILFPCENPLQDWWESLLYQSSSMRRSLEGQHCVVEQGRIWEREYLKSCPIHELEWRIRILTFQDDISRHKYGQRKCRNRYSLISKTDTVVASSFLKSVIMYLIFCENEYRVGQTVKSQK